MTLRWVRAMQIVFNVMGTKTKETVGRSVDDAEGYSIDWRILWISSIVYNWVQKTSYGRRENQLLQSYMLRMKLNLKEDDAYL
jgi:hypothetical protein